jgi:dihydropteroate synthase
MQMNVIVKPYIFGPVTYDLFARTYIMGVLNVTPDSFSDGGMYYDSERAVRRGLEMVEEGADFIDVGGESSRPGTEPISTDEELRRVIPVIERLAKSVDIPISIDTYKSAVAVHGLDAGAAIVNDISGLHFDGELAGVVAKRNASIILMHIKGTPRTMQQNPTYENVIDEICSYLQEGIRSAQEAGIVQIIVDPGIGFGKTLGHNLTILRKLREFRRFGIPVMVGPSRKSFIGAILDLPVGERVEGTLAALAVAVMNGANVVRVHDVKEMKRAAKVVDALMRSES